MADILFTVFTATFNRAQTLPRLYNSLCSQTRKNFEWIVVDDGSSDNTKELVLEWKRQSTEEFPIKYYNKTNGGKPRAINYGIRYAEGRYFIMVDSDDYLIDSAIEKMSDWVSEIDEMDDYIGVGAARGFSNAEYIKGTAPSVNKMGYVDCTNLERSMYNLDADMIEAYKTDIFRRFPMAEWPGENFAPEQIALNDIALAGLKLRWHADIIEICEYLPGGLTMSSFKLVKNNPMGYAMMYNHKLKYPMALGQKFKNACQHIALSIVGRSPSYILKSNNPILTLFALPAGLALSIRRLIQFSGVEK